MIFDPVANVWRSATPPKDPTRARVLTPEQYAARVENGRRAAAAQKELAAYIASPEYQQEVADMMARQEARKGQMRPLPGSYPGWFIYAGFRRRRRS
jgi:hypothetical protein